MSPMMLVAFLLAYWLLGLMFWLVRERRRARQELAVTIGRGGPFESRGAGKVVEVSGSIDLRKLLAVVLSGPVLAAAAWVLFG